MSDEFSLLKSLNNPKSKERPLLPAGISYTPRTVIVEGKNILVHVPSREIETFDRSYLELGENPNEYDFGNLLRNHRCIKSRDNI